MKDLESSKYIQSCLCDEKGFIKAEFLLSNENGLEIFVDESSFNVLFEELNKFIKFYRLEMKISSREIFYKFFQNNDNLFCDIGLRASKDEKLLTEEEFKLNILLLGQFLFSHQDVNKYRPHDIGMNITHVSFLKGCFRGQEVIARTEHLSKKKKVITPIKYEDEVSINSKKIKTLKEISFEKNIFKLTSFIPN